MGITNQSISDWCKGKRPIPQARQLELVIMFGLDAYMFSKDEMHFDYIERTMIEKAHVKYLGNELRVEQLENDIEILKLLKMTETWLVNGGSKEALLSLISK